MEHRYSATVKLQTYHHISFTIASRLLANVSFNYEFQVHTLIHDIEPEL